MGVGLNGPRLSLDQFEWEPTGSDDNPRSRLLATLYIEGWAFHVEAYEVKEKEGSYFHVTSDTMFEDDLDHYYAAANADGPFQTIRIEGREYVIVMTPFCS